MSDSSSPLWVEVAVFSALRKTLHYSVPDEWASRIQPGTRVQVPLGRREAMGLVLACTSTAPPVTDKIVLRPVLALLDASPVVPRDLLDLCRWIAHYYFYPLGEVLQACLPSGLTHPPEPVFRVTTLSRTECTSSELEIVSFIENKGLVTARELTAAFPARKHLVKELRKLETVGMIQKTFERTDSQPTPKLIKELEMVRWPESEQVKSARLHDFLQFMREEGGRTILGKLRQRVSNADYWIRKLTADGSAKLLITEEIREGGYAQDMGLEEEIQLTHGQQKVLQQVEEALEVNEFKPFVLFGVTGSGKTEIYLRLARKALDQNRSCLVLVPEIALTTQMEAWFRRRFGRRLAVWHSGLSTGVRHDMWHEIMSGRREVVLGARSAVFMPLPRLGLIIVDEEHDASYKQEDRLRYSARDVALMRAGASKIPILLGSATPSLQSYLHGNMGKYATLRLEERVYNRPQPDVEIVDMKRERGKHRILSARLQAALKETVENGEQALLFLNRRGFATFLLCNGCGYVMQCNACSVSMTYHQQAGHLLCHYCGEIKALPQECPQCRASALTPFGFGTERVEELVRELLPHAGCVRMDRDTVGHPHQMVEYLNLMRRQEAQILIGTQMVAKGHDFPNITLVGVVNADTSLQISDFRAGETTVQLLIQVAGRAGRGEKPGRVILQTYNPSHYTIDAVQKMDYEGFCAKELESREALQYPPFTRLLKILVTARDPSTTEAGAFRTAGLCRRIAQELRSANIHIAVLGPSPAPLAKLKNRYRWNIYVKAWTSKDLQVFTEAVLNESSRDARLRSVQLTVDRDPMVSI